MKAESGTYVALQNLYRDRARRDALLVLGNTKAILTALGRDPESITLDEITLFTKHANFVRKIDYRPVAAEYAADDHHKRAVTMAQESFNLEWNKTTIHDYVALRAWQEFYDRHGRPAGEEDATLETDAAEMQKIADEYWKGVGYDGDLDDNAQHMIGEIVRAGGGELHVIASLAGGIVAQEVVKVSWTERQEGMMADWYK
jgi:amyloid beta precursor protein binding protein 1